MNLYIGKIIIFTGSFTNLTMSNEDSSLYLRARNKQRDVVAKDKPNVSHQI